ncbi:hypothetical protein VTH06DRAFT_4839 [Thermothelomyces fergusii]
MRSALLSLIVAASATVSAQLVAPLLQSPFALERAQAPLMSPSGPGPALPPESSGTPAGNGGGVVLTDVMGRDRSMTLFASFVRDVESASSRLEDSSQNTTVLAPLNSEVEKLPRKPWEDPTEYEALGPNAYEGGEGRERAQRNLRRFVEAHLVPVSPWREGDKVQPVGGGREIWWEEQDGRRLIQPDGIEIVNVTGDVRNGQVWIIRGVRNYA